MVWVYVVKMVVCILEIVVVIEVISVNREWREYEDVKYFCMYFFVLVFFGELYCIWCEFLIFEVYWD